MSEYAFYSLSEAGLPQGVELLPLPVRRQSEGKIFGGDRVQVELLPEELIFFLAEHREFEKAYSSTLTALTWLVGVSEGMGGNAEAAARHLEMGLRLDPSNLLLRSNYALMLQLLDRKDEAVGEYGTVLADPDGLKNPMVRLLAARLYGDLERYQEAYDLLKPMAGERLGEDSYWDLLAEMKERAGIVDEENGSDELASQAAGEVTVANAPLPVGGPVTTCSQCGLTLRPEWAFCMGCGKPVEKAPTEKAFCIHCGAEIEKGQPFCDTCGRKT